LHHLESNALKSLTSHPELEDAYLTLGLTSVHEYIIRGEVELLARQVKLDPRYSSSIRDVWGATPLHWAATLGNIEAMFLLLDSGANIDAVCKYGKTVLHWAVRSKSAVCCQALVDAGANVNIMDGDGMTPLMVLLRHAPDREDIMDILLQAGVDVNMQGQSGMTALMTVAQCSTARSCAKILAYGADIELRDHGGCTAMVHAVYYRNEAALAFLIDKGSSLTKLDNQGRSIVHIAAARANFKIMKMLEAAHIEGVPKDAATIQNWWSWFNDRATWYQGIRAPLAEEFSAFQALVESVRPYQPPSLDIDSSFPVPGAYP
jgi:ankyrin repeat protein